MNQLLLKFRLFKTDKSDAKAICEYGQINDILLYNTLINIQIEYLQLFRLINSFFEVRTAEKNKIHDKYVLIKWLDYIKIDKLL